MLIEIPTPLLGPPILIGPHLSQQHAGLQHRVLQELRKVTWPLPEKSEVDKEAVMCQNIWVFHLDAITFSRPCVIDQKSCAQIVPT